jgi:hypothetical protein
MSNSSDDNSNNHASPWESYWMEGGAFPSEFILPCSPNFPYSCPVAVTAIVIALLGIIGNIAVVVSIVRQNLHRKTAHMSIMVLAVTDLLCLIVIIVREIVYFPNDYYLVDKYGFSVGFCIGFFVWNNTPYLSSCWNVVFLAYERYVLVTKPMVYMVSHTAKFLVIRAVATFLLVTIVNLVYAILIVQNGISQCPEFVLQPKHYGFVTVPIIFASVILLIFFHCSKVSKLKVRTSFEGRHSRNIQRIPHMTTTVYLIVIIYIVSQIPYLIFDVMSILESVKLIDWPFEFDNILLQISIVVFLTNFAINPFIYWITPVAYTWRHRNSSRRDFGNASVRTVSDRY